MSASATVPPGPRALSTRRTFAPARDAAIAAAIPAAPAPQTTTSVADSVFVMAASHGAFAGDEGSYPIDRAQILCVQFRVRDLDAVTRLYVHHEPQELQGVEHPKEVGVVPEVFDGFRREKSFHD